MLTLRPATPADAATAARLLTALHPDEPQGEAEIHHRWSQPHETVVLRRYLAMDGHQPVGTAVTNWPTEWRAGQPRFGGFELHLLPAAHRAGDYDRLLGELVGSIEEAGAEALESRVREDEDFGIAGLERNGFRRDRLSKAWELDLESNRERLLGLRSDSRTAMRELGVEMRTLADVSDPERYRLTFELDSVTTEDIPHTVPIVMPTFAEYLDHFRRTDVREDRYWTAWRDGELVAMSFLKYPSVGRVWTGYTCCRRDQRGNGIARAVKMETLGQAIELGVDRVRTDNDEQNAPMLHINEVLGYYRIPGFLSYLRP